MTTTEEIDSDYTLGVCAWCSDETPVFRDNMLCEDCDCDTIECAICGDRQHRDSRCRHVFQTDNLEWNGSGVGEPSDDIKTAFLKLLSLMPGGFAPDLKTAIESGRFRTFVVAPLIGSGASMELAGMPDRDGRFMMYAWGDAMLKLGEGEHADDIADGYHWLASLYEKDTPTANSTTIRWLDELGPKSVK